MVAAKHPDHAAARSWREVLLRAGLELGVDGLVEIAAVALEDGLPVLRDDADLREAARRSAAANVELLMAVVQDHGDLEDLEAPPAALAFARELARRHVPVAELGRAYRVAQHVLWQWSVDEIRAGIDDPALVAAAIEELSDAAFRTGDVISTLVMERYAIERERWMRSGEALRRSTVADLIDGRRIDVAAASRRLGYELRGEHLAFVVWSGDEEASPDTAAAAIAGSRGTTVPLGDGLVAGWAPPGALSGEVVGKDGGRPAVAPGGRAVEDGRWPPAGFVAEEVLAPARVRVAVGEPGGGVAGFRASHRQAMEARRVTRLLDAPGHAPVRYRDVALLALLTHDLAQARAFAVATLGPLAVRDDVGDRLASTLRALLEEQGSPRRAGRRLGVHENTVAKRQAAIDRALPPADRAAPAELLAALVLRDALTPAG